jgi:hypothetical protein
MRLYRVNAQYTRVVPIVLDVKSGSATLHHGDYADEPRHFARNSVSSLRASLGEDWVPEP